MKKFFFGLLGLLLCSSIFGQGYSEYYNKGKQYENNKQWCFALGAYYDALCTDEKPEIKKGALERYNLLSELILQGNPGIGKFNQFTIHDEWKKLLIDAEKFGCTFSKYELTVGKLVQGDLDYGTKTASYTAKIDYKIGSRYENTIGIIEVGYKKVYKSDWSDLPKEWPIFSVSSAKNAVFNVNGALIMKRIGVLSLYQRKDEEYYINAFSYLESPIRNGSIAKPGLYDYKFSIVDENGKELTKGQRWLLAESGQVVITGVPTTVMDLIDNSKAFIKLTNCYLEYGEYNRADDKGGRSFIKNLPEVQIPIDSVVCFYSGKNVRNKYNNFTQAKLYNEINSIEMVEISDLNIAFSKTEITQGLYSAIMGINPSDNIGNEFPVDTIRWYDAICFCNRLSKAKGLESVYSLNNEIDVDKWRYSSDGFGRWTENNITINSKANGFRLPTIKEWLYAAKGGENYKFAGSDKLDETAWYFENSNEISHKVATKKANAYGLYDMAGNVYEWCWDNWRNADLTGRVAIGGSYYDGEEEFDVSMGIELQYGQKYSNVGFRVVQNISK